MWYQFEMSITTQWTLLNNLLFLQVRPFEKTSIAKVAKKSMVWPQLGDVARSILKLLDANPIQTLLYLL
jgi:hypothetical protein